MTETKQWMGLHNHDRHFYSPGYGDRCGKCWYCSPETPCYCCLQAEVEALRAQVQRVRAVADAWEYYASENGNVRTAWAASSVREALEGRVDE